MAQPIITIDAALSALASATTPDEFIQLSNQAAALQVYDKARQARDGRPESLRRNPASRRTEARRTPGDDPEAA
jgi:hypothetical protein